MCVHGSKIAVYSTHIKIYNRMTKLDVTRIDEVGLRHAKHSSRILASEPLAPPAGRGGRTHWSACAALTAHRPPVAEMPKTLSPPAQQRKSEARE